MKQRILVTGASGFLGRHLVKRLVEEGYSLVLVSRRPPSTNIPRCRVIRCDLENARSVGRHAPTFRSCAVIVHLAACIPATPEADDPTAYHRGLRLGTLILSVVKPAHLVFASTIDVYGIIRRLPIREDHPTRPESYYAAAKLATEAYIGAYARRLLVPTAILRFSQVYGPGDTSAKLIPSVLHAVHRGVPPLLYGTGKDVRDYLFVEDAVDAIVLAVRRRASGVFNIGTGQGTSIQRAIRMIIQRSGRTMEPRARSSRKAPARMRFDVRAAKNRLGFVAKTGFSEGISQTVSASRPTIVLDYDGTLINNQRRYYRLYCHILGDLKPLSEKQYWTLKRRGVSERDIVSKTCPSPDFLDSYEAERLSLIEDMHFLKYDRVFPWTMTTLRKLRRTYSLRLVTSRRNRDNLIRQLRHLGLDKHLETVTCLDKSGPASALTIKAQALKHSERRIAAVVGDTAEDMDLANRLDVPGIAVLSGIRDRENLQRSAPRRIIRTLQDLPAAMQQIDRRPRSYRRAEA